MGGLRNKIVLYCMYQLDVGCNFQPPHALRPSCTPNVTRAFQRVLSPMLYQDSFLCRPNIYQQIFLLSTFPAHDIIQEACAISQQCSLSKVSITVNNIPE
jgi:hypothetical protein